MTQRLFHCGPSVWDFAMAAMRFRFLLFCVFVASVSSVRKLTNIDDLMKTRYGNSSPRHGLQLLFWFAQNVNFDQNNRMRLNFSPQLRVFGFHGFRNIDTPPLLPPLSPGQEYHIVGNLNERTHPQARNLPVYVQENYINSNLAQRNMDRLIVSLDQNQPTRTFRLFITSHNLNRNDYNSSDTYEIDPNLIQQIKRADQCSIMGNRLQNHNSEEERCLQFLQQTGYISKDCLNILPRKKRSLDPQCKEMKLEIKTTSTGYSELRWENIPANIFKTYPIVYVDICKNTYSSDTDKEPTLAGKHLDIDKSSGSLETSVLMNAGLQPRLRLLYTSYLSETRVRYGPEIHEANRELPIRIKGCDADLQLYTKDGKACARLYIKKTFSNWKNVLYYSWVGFYKRSQDKNDDYKAYCYVVDFAKIDKTHDAYENYDIYQFESSLPIAPGVQIRFLLDKTYYKVLAKTTPWESEKEKTSVCDKLSSPWYFPEFVDEPEFYDASNVFPSKIGDYDAGLQLFTKEGKACARLYIKNTFSNWKDVFYYSWVGFYFFSQSNYEYDTYEYAVNFKKMKDTQNFDIYEYKSTMPYMPGMQIRFLMDKGYDKEVVVETDL